MCVVSGGVVVMRVGLWEVVCWYMGVVWCDSVWVSCG